MGRVLDAQSLVPDLVISSTAVRARRSAELAMEAGGWACDMILDKALYDSGPEGVLEVAAAHGEMARLMLVGHEPTWSILVRVLTGERVEMKTSSVAVVDVASALPGMSLTPGQGELSRLLHPRSYFGSEWDVT
jgi:phosphohistidine phosphatase